MSTNVIMPALGVAQQSGILLKWLKAEGQTVTKGDPLMEIETDKATVEIEAAESGILAHLTAKAGDEVPVGQTIALILAPGEALPTRKDDPRKTAPQREHPRITQEGQSNPPASPFVKGGSKGDFATRVLASPKAKRIAKEQGIDLKSIGRGSGPDGAVLAGDVLRTAGSPASMAPTYDAQALIPLTAMRRIIGERMTQSKQSAPHFYLSMDIDMSAVTELRNSGQQRADEIIPSINDFILHATARALKDHPALNSSFTEAGVQRHAEINIGVAVALEEGLVVPVIRNADRLSLVNLAIQSRKLASKAQHKKLMPRDYEGGTFTVSNLGMLGVDSFIAIINPPQCAILAVGRVAPRVVADEGMFAIRSLMTATLSGDHRVIDGAMGGRFLLSLKSYLEQGNF
jgi:pyruvate dehydrogenase E2 component (dihydrolipoamide acetyltransferase)